MRTSRHLFPDPVIEPWPIVPRVLTVVLLAAASWSFPITAGMALLG